MNVCILSMQRVDNMGSLLQAYALKTIIEKLGNNVEFIDIIKREEDNVLLGDYRQEYNTEKEELGWIGKIKKLDCYTINRLKIKGKSKKQNGEFEKFRIKYLGIQKKSLKYDICIIGSDEVFNCLNSGTWGFTTQLFGKIPEADKIITYAASCGSTTYSELPEKIIERIKNAFENVEAFSVRDKNTREFVEKLTCKKVVDNLDPVLIYSFEKEMQQVSLPKVPEHYCVVYSYYNRVHTTEEITAIEKFCEKYKLKPIAVGAPQFWIKDYIVCSPFQCLKIFEKADFVITDTFHGTIFASKFAKKFAILIRDSNRNKMSDLVKKIKKEDHLIENMKEIETKYMLVKKEENFDDIVENESKRALEYLKKNL